ncbi:MAG: chaperone modulator CbpM [Flavobacteriales bacterium]|nr:chaperone modulator CbpM [Flavobacteriales bacterium]
MENQEYIPIHQLCTTYQVEITFFNELNEVGLIEITTIAEKQCLHQDNISDVEKMIRMHLDLEVNIQGIDVVFNLLQKVDKLQEKLIATENRLRIYEND